MRTAIQIHTRPRRWVAAAVAAPFLAAAPAVDARPDPSTGGSVSEKRAIVVVEPSAGFDWADAAVGAGAAAGIVLLAGGMASGLSHRRRLASS
jgi:hypothetical protein